LPLSGKCAAAHDILGLGGTHPPADAAPISQERKSSRPARLIVIELVRLSIDTTWTDDDPAA
jgi:hypothetical protein